MYRYLAVFFLFGLLFQAAGCATRSDVWHLEDRVERLAEENARLRDAISDIDGDISRREELSNALGDLSATQNAALYEIRQELRDLSGVIEEVEYKLDRDIKDLDGRLAGINTAVTDNKAAIADFDKRLSRMETYLGLELENAQKEGENAETGDLQDAESFKDLDEQELYRAAKQFFDNGDYDDAIDGFALFLEKFPDSDLADNALFWKGDVYFAEQWYEKAIVEYQKVIDDYPDGNKIPAAYLKQGIAFSRIGEDDNAVYILRELIQKFPDHNEAKIAESKVDEIDQ